MSMTYREAGDLIKALVDKVTQQSHPELAREHVTISTVIASRDTKKLGACQALKDRGLPIAAKTSITSLADRARNLPDAKLLIDDFAWQRLSSQRREALIDHELEHLDVLTIRPTKRNGFASGTKYDDLGRPCLKLRPHDWELTGFQSVAERHAEASIEAMQFAAFRDEYGQLNMFGPSVLQIAEKGQHDEDMPPFSKALQKQLAGAKLGPGVKVTDGEGHVLHDTPLLSRACAARHHAQCKVKDCSCEHHGKEKQVNA